MTTDELARIQQLNRDQVVGELRDAAEAFDNDPTDEDLERWETLQARSDDLDKLDADETARTERVAAAKAGIQVLRKAVVTKRPADAQDSQLTKAFDNYLRTGRPNDDITELRDMSPGGFRAAQGEGVGSAGGYLVPDEMATRMVDRLKAFGGIMSAAEVINTSNGQTIPWVTMDDTANEGEQVAEHAAAASGADLVFDKKELGAYRFDSVGAGGNPLRVSTILLEDTAFDIIGMIETKLPQRIMRHVSGKFINGTGANEPQGLLYGLTGTELIDDTNSITLDDLIAFSNTVIDPAYEALGNASWVMNNATWVVILQMKDSNGNSLWTNNNGGTVMADGRPAKQLLGYPVIIDQACPDLVVDDATVNWGAFGDFREGFVIRMVNTPTILVDPYGRMANGEVQYIASQRMDSIRNDQFAYGALAGETP